MEINQSPLGRIENIVIKDPDHLTIKYVPVQSGYNEVIVEPKLIASVSRRELIEREVIFDAPNKDVVLKVINVMEEIEVKDAKVTNGTILVTGYLNSCIMYTTMKRPQMENNNQNNNSQNSNNSDSHGYMSMGNDKSSNNNNKNKNKEKEKPKPSCGAVGDSIAVDGPVRHTTVRIPYTAYLPTADALEEDICTVTSFAVLKDLGTASVTLIYEEVNDEGETNANALTHVDVEPKFIKGIINKTLIELNVDLKRYPK
jgi:hypothetical protein